jgi:hypothetical protein
MTHRITHLAALLLAPLAAFAQARPEVAKRDLNATPAALTKQGMPPFKLEALVDFPDDALLAGITITPKHIDSMMQRLKELGMQRVSWAYYGDGHGGMICPTGFAADYQGGWKHYDATRRSLGNPLKVAVEAGHRHGLEVYAYFKPYETGAGLLFPEGSPEAKTMGLLPHVGGRLGWLDPFVKNHPELRVKRRTDDLPTDIEQSVVSSLRLIKKDASPTRITKERLQLWTSDTNWQYQQAKVDFTFTDTVEKAPRDVCDNRGNVLTRAGQPVRVLTLSGLNLTSKQVLITTDFADDVPDFVNAGTFMLEVMDTRGRVIPVEIASGASVWCSSLQNFRSSGLNFDYGWGAASLSLDRTNANGKQGLIAFTKGRNPYLCGALCETEPQVQKFWLQCLDEMIDAGVDGIDFREENHSMMTDHPEDYGFNKVILDQCGALKGEALTGKIAEVRGRAYTDFLRQCKSRLTITGKRMRYNLQADWFRSGRPADRALAYPANMNWEWPKWIAEGLMDEAILRFYHFQHAAILDDLVSRNMIERCQQHAIPVTFNQYINRSGTKGSEVQTQVRQVRADGRFNGFILYETSDFLRFDTGGGCSNTWPGLKALRNFTGQ